MLETSLHDFLGMFKQHLLGNNTKKLIQLFQQDAELVCTSELSIIRGNQSIENFYDTRFIKRIENITDLDYSYRIFHDKVASIIYRCQLIDMSGQYVTVCMMFTLIFQADRWLVTQQHISYQD